MAPVANHRQATVGRSTAGCRKWSTGCRRSRGLSRRFYRHWRLAGSIGECRYPTVSLPACVAIPRVHPPRVPIPCADPSRVAPDSRPTPVSLLAAPSGCGGHLVPPDTVSGHARRRSITSWRGNKFAIAQNRTSTLAATWGFAGVVCPVLCDLAGFWGGSGWSGGGCGAGHAERGRCGVGVRSGRAGWGDRGGCGGGREVEAVARRGVVVESYEGRGSGRALGGAQSGPGGVTSSRSHKTGHCCWL